MKIILLIIYMSGVSLVLFGAGLFIYKVLSFFKLKSAGLSLFTAYSSMVALTALALRNASGFEDLLWIYPLYLGYPANLLSAGVQEALERVFSTGSGMLNIPFPAIMIIYGGLQWFYIGLLIDRTGIFEARLGESAPVKVSPVAAGINKFMYIATIIAVVGYFSSLAAITLKTITISLMPGPVKESVFYSSPDLGKISQIQHFQRNGSPCYRLVGTHGAVTLDSNKKQIEKTIYNYPPKYYEWAKNAAVFAGGNGEGETFAVCSPGSGSDLIFFNSAGTAIWQYRFDRACGSCLPQTIDSGDLRGDGSYTIACAVSLPQGMGIGIPDWRAKNFRLIKDGLYGQACVADMNNSKKRVILAPDSMANESFVIMDEEGGILKRIKNPFAKTMRCLSAAGWFDPTVNRCIIFADDSAIHVIDQAGNALWSYECRGSKSRIFGAMLSTGKPGVKYFACLLSSGYGIDPSTLIVMDKNLKIVFRMQLKGDCPYMDAFGSYALIGAEGLVYKLTAGD